MPAPAPGSLPADFGRRLAACRQCLGLIQARVAAKLSVANAKSIRRYKGGTQGLRLCTIAVLGVEILEPKRTCAPSG